MDTVFWFSGDLSHALTLLTLIQHVHMRKSSAGISFKTQCLYTLVFIMRYIGSGSYMPSWSWSRPVTFFYIRAADLFFVLVSVYILFLILCLFRSTREGDSDTFKLRYVLPATFITSVILIPDTTIRELISAIFYGSNLWYYFLAVWIPCFLH
jgi:ER lumen protein retaining receptor